MGQVAYLLMLLFQRLYDTMADTDGGGGARWSGTSIALKKDLPGGSGRTLSTSTRPFATACSRARCLANCKTE